MTLLMLGLVLFLGTHSIRALAPGWRERRVAQLGATAWRGLYSLVALLGFVLIVVGYARARSLSPSLWVPPAWAMHLGIALTVPALVLWAASNVPRNRLKARVGHPLLAGTAVWAFAHLLANGREVDVLLFGAVLAWAVVALVAARRRDRAAGVAYPAGTARGDVATVVVGLGLWALFAFGAHAWLFGVAPLAWLGG
jgi:uncharacterized membrane protein